MKKLLPFFISLALMSCTKQDPAGPHSFRISSLGSGFSTEGLFEGSFQIHPDHIEMRFDKSHLKGSLTCPYKGRRYIFEVEVGLVTQGKEQGPDPLGFVLIASPNIELRPGEKFDIGPTVVQIPLPKDHSLENCWIAVQIEQKSIDLPEPQYTGLCYAYSSKSIFSGLGAISAQRSAPADAGHQAARAPEL
jgi:hypothetical protein